MIFKTLNGRERNVSLAPYAINWNPEREVSKPQAKVKAFLRPYWEHIFVCEEFRIPGSRLRLDIFTPSVAGGVVVEVSPAATHTKYNSFMHGSLSGYVRTIKRDLDKQKWAEANGFIFIELNDHDIANLSTALFAARGVTL